MKKYYGPIVLGITALTLAAPVAQTTTVLATDDGTETGTTTDPETPTDPDENTDEKLTEEQIKGNTDAYLAKISDFEKDLDGYNGSTPTLAVLKQYVQEQKDAISTDKPTTQSDFDTLNNNLDDKKSELSKITSNKITAYVQNDEDAKNPYFIIVDNVPIEKDAETTGIDISKDTNNNNLTGDLSIAADGTTLSISEPNKLADGQTTIEASNDTKAAAKEYVQKRIDVLKGDLSSNQPALDEIISDLNFQLQRLSPNKGVLENSTVTDVKSTVDNYLNDHTFLLTNVDETGQPQVVHAPLIKDATIYTPLENGKGEYLATTLDKDGNITKATVTDKNKNIIKTNTVLTVWKGAYDEKPANPIKSDNSNPSTNTNHHNNSNNNNNNQKPTTKPETKPEHTKTINAHHATFYALPNTITSLYGEDGQILKNRALGGNSSWVADKLMTLDGVNYLRVATNEWVKQNDGLEVTPLSHNVYTKNEARLYTASGNLVQNRSLAKNTAWVTDKSATINGQTMYRVATNEWVRAADLK